MLKIWIKITAFLKNNLILALFDQSDNKDKFNMETDLAYSITN